MPPYFQYSKVGGQTVCESRVTDQENLQMISKKSDDEPDYPWFSWTLVPQGSHSQTSENDVNMLRKEIMHNKIWEIVFLCSLQWHWLLLEVYCPIMWMAFEPVAQGWSRYSEFWCSFFFVTSWSRRKTRGVAQGGEPHGETRETSGGTVGAREASELDLQW